MQARRFLGFQNVNLVKISVSEPSALGLRCSKRSHPFFPVALRRPPRPLVSPQPGVRMLSPSSFFFGLGVGGRVELSPSTVRPFTASGARVRRHSRFSPTAYGPRANHLSVQHFTLHHPKQGRRGLSFVVEGVTSSRPSRHPNLRYVFLCTTLCFLYRISFTNGSAYQRYRFGFSAQFGPATTSVWEESPPLRWSSADSSKQRLEGFCATTGTFLPPTERSDRGNTSLGHRTRVLQPLLPCSKKGRRPEAHSESAPSEFFPLQREVQDADDENHHVSDSRRGLVCHYRPKGCIHSHPGRSATQEVPSVWIWREGLPIQGPSLRPGLGTENVHEMYGCCTGPVEVPGH